jgi:hypothetical protein
LDFILFLFNPDTKEEEKDFLNIYIYIYKLWSPGDQMASPFYSNCQKIPFVLWHDENPKKILIQCLYNLMHHLLTTVRMVAFMGYTRVHIVLNTWLSYDFVVRHQIYISINYIRNIVLMHSSILRRIWLNFMAQYLVFFSALLYFSQFFGFPTFSARVPLISRNAHLVHQNWYRISFI